MASWEKGAGFRICGHVVRVPFLARSGKFAKVTLAVPGGGRSGTGEKKIDVRAFEADVIAEIAQLGAGMTVQITGNVDSESVKDKAGNSVKVDGYDVWVSVLTAKKVDVEGSSRKPAEKPDAGDPEAVRKAW